MKKPLLTLIVLLNTLISIAQVSSDYAVLVSATNSTTPPSIQLYWPLYGNATDYTIYKKELSTTSWGTSIATLSGTATTYTDNDVIIDSAYEYKIVRNSTTGIIGEGYLIGGIELSVVDYRGTCLLVLDTTITTDLTNEIYQLKKDISGDGWAVEELHVARDMSPTFVRDLIIGRANANTAITALFLFGRVPVLYSGNLYPDGHPDHQGAWPADGIYGDIDVEYTDATVDNIVAARIENQNVPADGKYDQSVFKSKLELEVGRVDLYNMPTFILDEASLLKRYLQADHEFRTGVHIYARRALIDDNFGAFAGEAFASSGWRNFAPMFGSSEIYEADYFTTMYTNDYLWSYGCGGGWFQGAGGVGTTNDFALDTVKSAFTMLFGSYFGDWDANDDFLRAPLASGKTLTNCWAGRPHWHFHNMAMGANIGYSARLTQNNQSTYVSNIFPKWVHIALMGDPTLRMHIVQPPATISLAIPTGETSVIGIDYTNSPDPDVIGYYVYRSATEFGVYERITEELINYSPFIDEEPIHGTNYYMVKAVKLETSSSGSYYNTSTGISDSIFIEYVSIENNLAATISIAPNPASDHISINFTANPLQTNYTITNLEGKIYLQGLINVSSNKINIQMLPEGMYLFNLGDYHKKFMVMN